MTFVESCFAGIDKASNGVAVVLGRQTVDDQEKPPTIFLQMGSVLKHCRLIILYAHHLAFPLWGGREWTE